MKYIQGARVEREDGRFYVPVLRSQPIEGLSSTVLRVASDAFQTVEQAEDFASIVTNALNEITK